MSVRDGIRFQYSPTHPAGVFWRVREHCVSGSLRMRNVRSRSDGHGHLRHEQRGERAVHAVGGVGCQAHHGRIAQGRDGHRVRHEVKDSEMSEA